MSEGAPALALSDAIVADRLHEAAAIHLGTLHRNSGGRLDPRVVNGATTVYNVFRKAHFATGQHAGFVTMFDLAQALYPSVMNGHDARRKAPAIRLHLRRLQAAGALLLRTQTSPAGQVLGLWWELQAGETVAECWPDLHGYSAKRYPERAAAAAQAPLAGGCELRRRRALPRHDPRRRVHRWNPRIGHGSERRYDVLRLDHPDAAAIAHARLGLTNGAVSTPSPFRGERGGATAGGASGSKRLFVPLLAAPPHSPLKGLGGEAAEEGKTETRVSDRGSRSAAPRSNGEQGSTGPRRESGTVHEPIGDGAATNERRDRAPREVRPWAALTRCRKAASGGGGPLAVLDVPRADCWSKAAAAFEAVFVAPDAPYSTAAVDPVYLPPLGVQEALAAGAAAPREPDPDERRYITLSATWARRLEVWCRMYDRAAGQPGAGIRSLVEDIEHWTPADGAPLRDGGRELRGSAKGADEPRSWMGRAAQHADADNDEPIGDPGAPIALAFFVARLGRRAKALRIRSGGPKAKTRGANRIDWSLGDRW